MKLNDQELATIIAALRLWQMYLDGAGSDYMYATANGLYHEIAGDGGIEQLSVSQIDELCERINTE